MLHNLSNKKLFSIDRMKCFVNIFNMKHKITHACAHTGQLLGQWKF